MPIAKLNKSIIKAASNLQDRGTSYEPVQGNKNLRRMIARWSLVLDGKLHEDDIYGNLFFGAERPKPCTMRVSLCGVVPCLKP